MLFWDGRKSDQCGGRICEGCRRAVKKTLGELEIPFCMLVLSQVIIEHLKYPLRQKLKFNKNFFFVKKFVDMNRNQRGRIPKHKDQC